MKTDDDDDDDEIDVAKIAIDEKTILEIKVIEATTRSR